MNHEQDAVVVLDRDGTIIVDRHYLADPSGLQFEPGAERGLQAMAGLGYRLVVVTNQSGIARGYFDVARLEDIHRELRRMLTAIGVSLEGIYYCPHGPDDGCECRKPNQGLMRRAAADLGFDPARAVVIGDKDSDIEFGRRAGALTIRVGGGEDRADRVSADHDVRDLDEAAKILAGRRR